MTNGDPEGRIFLSYPHTNNGFFSCSPLFLLIYFWISFQESLNKQRCNFTWRRYLTLWIRARQKSWRAGKWFYARSKAVISLLFVYHLLVITFYAHWVKSGIFGQTAKFGQRPCLFHISNIGIKNKSTKQTVKILMRRLTRSRLIWIYTVCKCVSEFTWCPNLPDFTLIAFYL